MNPSPEHRIYSSAHSLRDGASLRCECGWRVDGERLNAAVDAYAEHYAEGVMNVEHDLTRLSDAMEANRA